MTRWWGILLQGLVTGILGILVYSAVCYLFKVKELQAIYQGLKMKWGKLKNTLPTDLEESRPLS
jgi:hypothetical protein